MRHAIIDKNTNKVLRVIIYDGKAEWKQPDNCLLVQSDIVDKGDLYDQKTNTFTKFHQLKD